MRGGFPCKRFTKLVDKANADSCDRLRSEGDASVPTLIARTIEVIEQHPLWQQPASQGTEVPASPCSERRPPPKRGPPDSSGLVPSAACAHALPLGASDLARSAVCGFWLQKKTPHPTLGPLDPWTLDPWTFGPLDAWTFGPWTLGPLDHWTLDHWIIGLLAIPWTVGPLDLAP